MNVPATGGCRARAHSGDLAARMALYDSLPPAIRDALKLARSNLCVACIRNRLRREGEAATLQHLEFERRARREKVGRDLVLIAEEDLRP